MTETSRKLPLATVAVRSYGRLPAVLELAPRVLAQDYPNFELLIIEQSPEEQRSAVRAELAALGKDPRVRILEYGKLGSARARNEAWQNARGEVLIFIDDDDLPIGDGWVSAFMRNFEDPKCMAVSGRQLWTLDEDPRPHDTWRARRVCLRYSFLKMPRAYVRHANRVEGVTQVAGGNSAIRLEAIRRAGGWDVVDDHDEDSFAFRFAKVKRPGEYFAYDPLAMMLRRLDIPGGVGRRQASPRKLLRSELEYSHLLVARYYPWLFWWAYPMYLWLAFRRAFHDTRRANEPPPVLSTVAELLASGPEELAAVWRKRRTQRV